MNNTLDELRRLEARLREVNKQMAFEAKITRLEQQERTALGLHGDEAIKHYNEWMQRYGLEHLMVKKQKK